MIRVLLLRGLAKEGLDFNIKKLVKKRLTHFSKILIFDFSTCKHPKSNPKTYEGTQKNPAL
jgi:hypothetical protein